MANVTRLGFLTGLLGLFGVVQAKPVSADVVDFHARNVEASDGLIGGYLKVRSAQSENLHSDFLGARNLNVQHATYTYRLDATVAKTGRLVLPVGVDAWTTQEDLDR